VKRGEEASNPAHERSLRGKLLFVWYRFLTMLVIVRLRLSATARFLWWKVTPLIRSNKGKARGEPFSREKVASMLTQLRKRKGQFLVYGDNRRILVRLTPHRIEYHGHPDLSEREEDVVRFVYKNFQSGHGWIYNNRGEAFHDIDEWIAATRKGPIEEEQGEAG
jgi:hypothetical protein